MSGLARKIVDTVSNNPLIVGIPAATTAIGSTIGTVNASLTRKKLGEEGDKDRAAMQGAVEAIKTQSDEDLKRQLAIQHLENLKNEISSYKVAFIKPIISGLKGAARFSAGPAADIAIVGGATVGADAILKKQWAKRLSKLKTKTGLSEDTLNNIAQQTRGY